MKLPWKLFELLHDADKDLALLLVPSADETEWLTREDYVDKHRVGVVALRPDIEPPDWFRDLITAHATIGPGSSANAS